MQRGALIFVAGIAIGTGIQQYPDDIGIAECTCLDECRGLQGTARIDTRLVTQKQLHADRIIIAHGGGNQGRLAIGGLGLAAAFHQEFRQSPIIRDTGDTERIEPFVGQRFAGRTGIEQ